MNKWIRVGKAKEAHGLKGDLYILLFAKEAPWLKQLKSFALSTSDEGPFETFEVDKVKPHKDGLILKAKQLPDRTAAENKLGLLFYLPQDMMVSQKGEAIYLREIHGFTVRTDQLELGPIENFSSNGPQDLLVIRHQNRLIEIPFVEAFLKKIDFESRTVWMDLPEGLWDLE